MEWGEWLLKLREERSKRAFENLKRREYSRQATSKPWRHRRRNLDVSSGSDKLARHGSVINLLREKKHEAGSILILTLIEILRELATEKKR